MNNLMDLTFPVLFIAALAISAILTPIFRRIALWTMVFVQQPKAISIETHIKPIPVGGGVAIFLGMVGALLITGPWIGFEKRLLLAGAVIVLLGLLDDSRALKVPLRRGWDFVSRYVLDLEHQALSVPTKFVAQFFVAYLLIMAPGLGGRLAIPQFFGSAILNQVVAVVWLVGLQNAFNFIDIMDGLAAGTSAIAALGFFSLAIAMSLEPPFASLAIALAGSTLGFLIFNFNPARIFMGDTGSQFLGLFLGTLALQATVSSRPLVMLWPTLVLLGIPLFEISFTMTIRALTRKAPWKGSKDHYPLRMFKLGFSVRQIVVATYLVGVGLIPIALWLVQVDTLGRLMLLALLALMAFGVGLWLSRVKVPKIVSPAVGAAAQVAPAPESLIAHQFGLPNATEEQK